MKDKITQYFIFSLLVGCLVILGILMVNLSDTVDSLAKTLIDQNSNHVRTELDNFFAPVDRDVSITAEMGESGLFDSMSVEQFDYQFIPFLKNSMTISSMMMANEHGDEYMLLQMDSTWVNRVTKEGCTASQAHRYEWNYQNHHLAQINNWEDEKVYDPRTRPWFIGANENELHEIYWTEPYTFFTTKDPGITASVKWTAQDGETRVFGFDLLLLDISRFTSSLEISENGKVYVLTEDNRVLGLPHEARFSNKDSLKLNVLKTVDELNDDELSAALVGFGKTTLGDCYQFYIHDEPWRGSIDTFRLGDQTFKIVVIAPESDFLAQIKRTRMLIIGGFILIIFFAIIIIRAYRQKRKANLELQVQKQEVEKQRDIANKEHRVAEEQKLIVQEKNREIMDSINYAKRIQHAILPPEELVSKYIDKNFILYLPKDVVAGDFYWFEPLGDHILLAAADCTGHGVPGAMVSVVCHNSLNRAVREFGLTDPGEILDKVTELVIETFERSNEEVKDGMDIALISIPKTTESSKTITYAGANNSLYYVQDGELKEIKADKQPIGKYTERKPFTTKSIDVHEGDMIYLYSDGYADQFGGPRGKKFKYKPLKNLLLQNASNPVDYQKKILIHEFIDWKSDLEQIDDVCIIGVRI
jgi:serine phosphatase RsbU (regulator of sigma subunit)